MRSASTDSRHAVGHTFGPRHIRLLNKWKKGAQNRNGEVLRKHYPVPVLFFPEMNRSVHSAQLPFSVRSSAIFVLSRAWSFAILSRISQAPRWPLQNPHYRRTYSQIPQRPCPLPFKNSAAFWNIEKSILLSGCYRKQNEDWLWKNSPSSVSLKSGMVNL